MHSYLPDSILNLIYGYMNWSELCPYHPVPDYIWKKHYDNLCQDDRFRYQVHQYWGTIIDTISYRLRILNFIHYISKYVVPSILLNNREFILQTAKYGHYINDDFMDDPEVTLHLLTHRPWLLEKLHFRLRGNRNFILQAVARNGFVILFVHNNVKYDTEVLTTAATQISVEMTDNKHEVFRQIIMLAIRKGVLRVYDDIDPVYKSDPEILLISGEDRNERIRLVNADKATTIAFLKRGGSYRVINSAYWNDRDVAIAALENNPNSYLPLINCEALRNDRQYVLQYVQKAGYILEYTKLFQADPEIVMTATKQWHHAFYYAADILKQNKNFVLQILSIDAIVYYWIDASLKLDPDILCVISRYNYGQCSKVIYEQYYNL